MTINTFSLGGDLTVNRLGFGAMRLAMGTFDGPVRAPETGIKVLRRAVELGVNHIDTAGFYGRGPVQANELIHRALTPYPDGLVIATKVGPLRGPKGLPSEQATPGQLRGLVEADLCSLGLDRLDLVYLRVGGGLIRHLGVSNVDAAQLAEARAIAPVTAVQNRHPGDLGLLAACEKTGIAYVPYFPLGGGVEPLDTDRLGRVAARLGATTAQVAIASLLARSPSVLAIPGTGSLDHLEENLTADLTLTEEALADLRR
ncbi:aldo/keto reductase [Streptomyces sp. NPDC007164]|uniref:aldo/keto reductase n=1 Tax=Streptomyces sp. NPDC007164 TaxID=3156918 RepID=UPI0033EFC366